MRRLLLVAATALALSASPALAQQVVEFAIEGTNLDGSPYGGTATITWISDSTCTIVWNTGGTPLEGICMQNGNSFAAAYSTDTTNGLVVYNVIEDKRQLQGIWTITGVNGYGTELLTRTTD